MYSSKRKKNGLPSVLVKGDNLRQEMVYGVKESVGKDRRILGPRRGIESGPSANCSARGAAGASASGGEVLCISISCLFSVVCRIIIDNY